ncbi:hypothetical protein [Aquimarina sp. 2201CG5-10]|uniref:hypothetical protein n=1 Tax=Aquimarina callyspongiae TaxID=3098150 RepID=UPI002AB4D91F|nr:hypothetical protein [Aquimarina sp. 2201CG5-10]MDY8137587.1 hypothetical protein [Aquimarina sp. 2201CG5-10]
MSNNKEYRVTYILEGDVILEKGKIILESYGNNNLGSNEDFIAEVKLLIEEWNETAMHGYGKTLLRLYKTNNTTKQRTLIYSN